MHGFGFNTLALLIVTDLAGPLLASLSHLWILTVVGELIAGLVLDKIGFGVVDDANLTFQLFANIDFVLVMFVVGTYAPVHDPKMCFAVPMVLVCGFGRRRPRGAEWIGDHRLRGSDVCVVACGRSQGLTSAHA